MGKSNIADMIESSFNASRRPLAGILRLDGQSDFPAQPDPEAELSLEEEIAATITRHGSSRVEKLLRNMWSGPQASLVLSTLDYSNPCGPARAHAVDKKLSSPSKRNQAAHAREQKSLYTRQLREHLAALFQGKLSTASKCLSRTQVAKLVAKEYKPPTVLIGPDFQKKVSYKTVERAARALGVWDK